ncbi:hypothetical protein [Agromyces bauzanensis]
MTKPERGLPADFYPPDLEHVPTVSELALQGLARVQVTNAGGDPKLVTILPEGQRLINEAMHRNAERMRAWQEVARTHKSPVPA